MNEPMPYWFLRGNTFELSWGFERAYNGVRSEGRDCIFGDRNQHVWHAKNLADHAANVLSCVGTDDCARASRECATAKIPA